MSSIDLGHEHSSAYRAFSPNLVGRLEGFSLFVDRVQPVAALVDERGLVRSITDWRHLASTPRKDSVTWPHRTLCRGVDGTVWLSENSEDYEIDFSLDAKSNVVAARTDEAARPPVSRRQNSRFSSSGELMLRRGAGDEFRLTYSSVLDGFRWTSSVTGSERCTGSQTFELGRGSITSIEALENGSAAVCVRRADKRPWVFAPDHDMVILFPNEERVLRSDAFDISPLSWTVHSVDLAGEADEAYFAQHLTHAEAECSALVRHGARSASYAVRSDGHVPWIEIRAEFDRDGPGTVTRVDRPFDELGRRSRGLLGLGIFVDDDFTTDAIFRLADADHI